MESTYLVRYGSMRHFGRFLADSDSFERGQTVVIQSCRGIELGEVILPIMAGTEASPTPHPSPSRILRAAGVADLERARQVERDRPSRLAACERVLNDGTWPIDLIDVEPMLDDRRTVLLYLGTHRLDAMHLLATFREVGLDVAFEPIGLDAADDAETHGSGCGSCGSGDGGCGSGGGCSGCAVKDLLASRRSATAHL